MTKNIMIDSLKMSQGYNIALHGIKESKGSREIAESIMENGLNLPSGAWSIRSTTVQLGDKYRNSNFRNDFQLALRNYQFGVDSEGYSIIIQTPTIIKNSKGDLLFLGDPYTGIYKQDFANLDTSQKYKTTCILDLVSAKLGRILLQFVFGYVDSKTGEIIKNPRHYLQFKNDSPEEMDSLFDTIKNSLQDVEMELSESIAKCDDGKLERFKNLFAQYDLKELISIIEKVENQYGINKEKTEYDRDE